MKKLMAAAALALAGCSDSDDGFRPFQNKNEYVECSEKIFGKAQAFVFRKGDSAPLRVESVDDGGVEIGGASCSWEELFDGFKFTDGSPCGAKV